MPKPKHLIISLAIALAVTLTPKADDAKPSGTNQPLAIASTNAPAAKPEQMAKVPLEPLRDAVTFARMLANYYVVERGKSSAVVEEMLKAIARIEKEAKPE